MNIGVLRLNFVEFEHFLESYCPDILALRWIFPWIILSWHSCSMWDKFGSLNWFWQFFCEGSPSLYLKGFCYSYASSWSLGEGRTSFCTGHVSIKLCRFLLMFSTGFTSFCVLLLFPISITFPVIMHNF